MNDPYNFYANLINQHFSTPFDALYKGGGKVDRAKLLPCIANIYRRWYYSSLVENTYLTPANLFESLNHQCGKPAHLSPVVNMRTPVNYTGLHFNYQEYTRKNHPIVADFRIIIDYCKPDIELTDTNQMPEELAFEVAKTLHMNDPFYAMFLLSIALEMDFLVKIPSIHANRYQLARGIERRLSIPDTDLFDKIVNHALSYASRSLSELIPLPVPLFDEEYLTGILKEPVETDVIFQRLYDTIGVDIEDLIGLDIFEELDMLDMAVISGTYLLGIVLDKFFLTPFGHYLKLIRPIYMLPFDFENEVTVFLDAYIDEDELGIAFYAPCSCYYLTEMGLDFFDIKPNPANFLDIGQKLKFSEISPIFDKSQAKLPNFGALTKAFDRDVLIYSLKVKYLPDTRLWINIDVSDIISLHRLYLELAYYFDLDKNGEYMFFPDETENPFMAYASPSKPRRAKKASDTVLGSLGLKEKQVMILAVSYPKAAGMAMSRHKDRWALEVTKVHKGKPGMSYPVVTRIGKALKEYFEWM